MTARLWRCGPTSDGVPIIWKSTRAIARSSVFSSSSTPATARLCLVRGRQRRRFWRDGARSHGRCGRTAVWSNANAASRRMAVGQRQRLHRKGHRRLGASARPQNVVHAGAQSEKQRHVRELVKTSKRAYARLKVLTDAADILAMLPDWIEDHCEVYPHSGLKFRSPREFIRLSCLTHPGRCPVK